jgi:hypothetical protein
VLEAKPFNGEKENEKEGVVMLTLGCNYKSGKGEKRQ